MQRTKILEVEPALRGHQVFVQLARLIRLPVRQAQRTVSSRWQVPGQKDLRGRGAPSKGT